MTRDKSEAGLWQWLTLVNHALGLILGVVLVATSIVGHQGAIYEAPPRLVFGVLGYLLAIATYRSIKYEVSSSAA